MMDVSVDEKQIFGLNRVGGISSSIETGDAVIYRDGSSCMCFGFVLPINIDARVAKPAIQGEREPKRYRDVESTGRKSRRRHVEEECGLKDRRTWGATIWGWAYYEGYGSS
jgi:hypothetical protein